MVHRIEGQRLGRNEFVALVAMMFASVAFSIDAMLPAMPEIARDLDLSNPQQAPMILLIFVIGMGAGSLIMGPLSDAVGRRPIVFWGLFLYVIGAVLAWSAPTFETMLAARLLQGFGAAGPRIVSAAIIRDLFRGREMASILSLSLMLFLIAPAFAPAIGALTMEVTDWRGIFMVFVAFATVLGLWFHFRVTETLLPENRRPFRIRPLLDGMAETFQHPVVRISIIVQTLLMGMLFSILTMVQPIFSQYFDRAADFPYWFGALAIASGFSSFLNSRLVLRFGMRRMATTALLAQAFISAIVYLLMTGEGAWLFWLYLFWQFSVLFQAGLTTGNLNAIAAEPMGHIAGTAAAVMGSVSTMGGALLATPLAYLFDGTPRPLIGIIFVITTICTVLMLIMRHAEGKLILTTHQAQ